MTHETVKGNRVETVSPANPAQGVSEALTHLTKLLHEARSVYATAESAGIDVTVGLYRRLREGHGCIDALTAAIGAGGQAVAVRPLDFSTVLRHAFLSGVAAARAIPAGDECDGPKLWTEYEPYEPGAYARILSALSNPPAQPGWRDSLRDKIVGAVSDLLADERSSKYVLASDIDKAEALADRILPAAPLPGGAK